MNKLTKEQFMEEIKEMVSVQMGLGYQVALQSVVKNNNQPQTGLIIKKFDKATAPLIYLDCFFDEYQSGKDLEQIIDEVIDICMKNEDSVSFNAEQFMQFESIKTRIVQKLINHEKNKELLVNAPHERIMDLAAVCYIIADQIEQGYATILVRNEHLGLWDITEEDLFKYARKNSPRLLPSTITSMSDILKQLMGDTWDNGSGQEPNPLEPELFILSNVSQCNGATSILYHGVLKAFAMEHETDVVILPSSLHEVLLFPVRDEIDTAYLNEMVREINRNEVAPEDVLSDSIYMYKLESDSIGIIK